MYHPFSVKERLLSLQSSHITCEYSHFGYCNSNTDSHVRMVFVITSECVLQLYLDIPTVCAGTYPCREGLSDVQSVSVEYDEICEWFELFSWGVWNILGFLVNERLGTQQKQH